MERDQQLALDIPTCKSCLSVNKAVQSYILIHIYLTKLDENIECPPSILPQKKYCDITGLDAKYTDPKTGLRYHSAEIYQFIRTLGVPNVQAYLASRNAAVVLK